MKKTTIYISLAALALLAGGPFARCLALNTRNTGNAVVDGEWKLLPVLASDTATGIIPVLNFNVATRSFTGNTGCNAFSGKFMLNGDKLQFKEQAVLTQNGCPGYNESAFIGSLIKVNHFRIVEGTVLELMFDGTVLSRWVRKEPVNKPAKV